MGKRWGAGVLDELWQVQAFEMSRARGRVRRGEVRVE